MVLKLQSEHHFQTKNYKEHDFIKILMLWFLIYANQLVMLDICTKFGKNISKGFGVIEQTQKNLQRCIIQ